MYFMLLPSIFMGLLLNKHSYTHQREHLETYTADFSYNHMYLNRG